MRGFLILVLLLSGIFSNAQESVEASITIKDISGKPIPNAEIRFLNSEIGVVSAKNGTAKILIVTKGNYLVQINADGYASNTKLVSINESIDINITLEESYRKLDDIVVNANKNDELYFKTAGSITSIGTKQIKDLRIWDIQDLSGLAPNFNLAQSGDNRNIAFIRGIGTTSYEQAVSTYIDGVAQFTLDSYIPQLNNVEKIEILNGPQGTLYGRNAMAGVINITTKKPVNKPSLNAGVSIAGYGQKRFNLSGQLPLVKDKLFGSLSILKDIRNGYYTNDFSGKFFDKQDQTGLNVQIRYFISKRWLAQLDHKSYWGTNDGAFPLSSDITQALKKPFHLSQDQQSTMHDKTTNNSIVVKYKGSKIDLSIQNSLQKNYRYYHDVLDADFSDFNIVGIYNNYGTDHNFSRAFTQEIRVSSNEQSSSKLKWIVGSYYYNQFSPTKQATVFGKNADFIGAPMNDFSVINTNVSNNNGMAIYANGTYNITEKLSIISGIRFDRELRKLSVSSAFEKKPDPAVITSPETSGKISYAAISPKVGIQFTPRENSLIYLTYNRGFRTGGLTSITSDPSQIPLIAYKPEYSNTVEAGIRSESKNKKLRSGFVLFYSIVNDLQIPTLVLPDAITITKNAGKLESKGIEYELNAIIFSGLTMNYTGGMTDARFKSFKTGQNGDIVDLAGKRQIFTPLSTDFLSVQYQRKIDKAKKIGMMLRAEYKFFGKQYFDVANNIKQDQYGLLNLKAGIDFKNAALSIWARNTGDKKYIAYAYDFGAVYLGNPRVIGMSIDVKL